MDIDALARIECENAAKAIASSGPEDLIRLERQEDTSLLVSFGVQEVEMSPGGPPPAAGRIALLSDLTEYARRFEKTTGSPAFVRLLIQFGPEEEEEPAPVSAEDEDAQLAAALAASAAEADGTGGLPSSPVVANRRAKSTKLAPPRVRLLYPLIEFGSGNVINGLPLLPGLFPRGWSPELFTPLMAVQWVRDLLITNGARVHLESRAFYPKQGYEATRKKLWSLPPPGIVHPKKLERKLFAYSSKFALETMGLELPEGFECGNKVLLSPVLLHSLTLANDREHEEGRRARNTDDMLAAFLRSARGERSADSNDDDDDASAALTFELTSHLGFPAYVGVASFVCPHKDIVIVPSELMFSSLGGIADGTEVNLRRVKLPPVSHVVLQPHSVNFQAVRAFFGMEPREFLERSLVRYATLAVGDVIATDGGPDLAASAASSSAAAASARAGVGGGSVSGRPVGTSDSDYATDEQLAALLSDAFDSGSSASAGGAGGGSNGKVDPDGLPFSSPELFGSPSGSMVNRPANMVFRFTVIAVKSPLAPPDKQPLACALWSSFGGQVSIEFLPAVDEFMVPEEGRSSNGAAGRGGAGAGAGAGANPVEGILRADMLDQVFGGTHPGASSGSAGPTTSSASAAASAIAAAAPTPAPAPAPPALVAPIVSPQAAPTAGAAGTSTAGAAGTSDGGPALSAEERRARAAEAARRRFQAAPTNATSSETSSQAAAAPAPATATAAGRPGSLRVPSAGQDPQ